MTDVLFSRCQEPETRSALIRIRSDRLVQRFNLHFALGGDFEAPPPSFP